MHCPVVVVRYAIQLQGHAGENPALLIPLVIGTSGFLSKRTGEPHSVGFYLAVFAASMASVMALTGLVADGSGRIP